MKLRVLRAPLLAIVAVLTGVTAVAQQPAQPMPRETATYRQSDLPGYALVQRNCLTCHSAQYVSTQPRLPRAYWEATVRKMKSPFGALFPDEDIPAMVDYLSKTYGSEGPAASPAAPTPGSPRSAAPVK
jgi:sulfite dehydrogenase